MHHIFPIHLSVNGHLNCFHFLVIINSAAINIGLQVFFLIIVSKKSHNGNSNFLRNLHTGRTNLHFQNSVGGFLFQMDSQKKNGQSLRKENYFLLLQIFLPLFSM